METKCTAIAQPAGGPPGRFAIAGASLRLRRTIAVSRRVSIYGPGGLDIRLGLRRRIRGELRRFGQLARSRRLGRQEPLASRLGAALHF